MTKYVPGIGLLLCMEAVLASTQDLSFAARMDVAHWHVTDSALECRLTQPLPFFGEAVFARRAGEDLRFFLTARDNPLRAGTAELVSQPPVWGSQRAPIHLGEAEVALSKQPINLDETLATRMLGELLKGMAPRFLHVAWYSAVEPIDVGISPVYFRDAYKKYQHCLNHLLPYKFAQIKSSQVNFETDKAALSHSAIQRLNAVARYVTAEKSIKNIIVAGHTDNVWDADYNIDLSQRRAKSVARHLLAQGVDKKLISHRYHGERHPLAPNNNPENRARNRRVMVLLQR